MDGTWWLLPVLIVVAVGVTAGYFFGRKTNATLMKAYANALENSLKPIDQDYTWLGGYVGYRATYKVKNDIVKQVKATLHWVSAAHAIDAEVRLFDHLFTKEDPNEVEDGEDWKDGINPDSLEVLKSCKLEPNLKNVEPGFRCQFERQGYFCVDSVDSTAEKLVFNRTVSLRDSWAKIEKAQKQG